MEHIKTDELYKQAIKYFDGDIKRIQHFTKVYTFASLIGRLEKLSDKEQYILEAAAIVHDIGIKNAEKEYGSCEGKLQEKRALPLHENCSLRLILPKVILTEYAFLSATTTLTKHRR